MTCVFKSAIICSNLPYIHEFSCNSQHIVSSVVEVNTIAHAQRGDIHDSQADVNSLANPASYACTNGHMHGAGAVSIAGLQPKRLRRRPDHQQSVWRRRKKEKGRVRVKSSKGKREERRPRRLDHQGGSFGRFELFLSFNTYYRGIIYDQIRQQHSSTFVLPGVFNNCHDL